MTGDYFSTFGLKPPLDGIVFRLYRGQSDIDSIISVRQQVAEWDKVDPKSSRESPPSPQELREGWALVEPGDPNKLLAEIGGEVVGYTTISWWTEQTGVVVYLHLNWLLPHWRGKGIGTTMLHWSQARIREMVAERGEGSRATFATNVSSTETEAATLMQNEGYRVVRRLSDMALRDMTSLPEAKLPVGLELRPVVSDHYRTIYEAHTDAWSKGNLMPQANEENFQEFVADSLSGDPALYRVGWSDDQVVGLVLCHIRNGVGTVDEVEVRQAWQRQGIARALLLSALHALGERGVEETRLYNNADNPFGARTLYESIGFQEVKQHYFYRKPVE